MNGRSAFGLGLPDMLEKSQGKTFNQEAKSITLHRWQKTRSTGRSLVRYRASVFTTTYCNLWQRNEITETPRWYVVDAWFKAAVINIFIGSNDCLHVKIGVTLCDEPIENYHPTLQFSSSIRTVSASFSSFWLYRPLTTRLLFPFTLIALISVFCIFFCL